MKHRHLSKLSLIGLALSTAQIAIAEDATNTLPNAKPGECYAKVVLPAQFQTKTEDVVVKEASEKITIIPAKYKWVKEKVLVKEPSTKVLPVEAIYGKVTEKIEVSPTRQYWATGKDKGATPASEALISIVAKAGINLKTAIPGQCFVESYTPAKYETKVEKVLTRQASESVKIIPAKYGMVSEKVLVKDASKTVVEVPATYETVKEKVLVEPAKTMWKKGHGLAERIDNTTGEIMCLVEVPAKYKTVSKRIIKTKATTKVVEIPAEYSTVSVRKLLVAPQEVRTKIPEEFTSVDKTVKTSDEKFSWHSDKTKTAPGSTLTGNKICLKEIPAKFKTLSKRIVKSPATTKTIKIPAEYKFVKVRKLVTPPQENRISIPAKYQTVTKRIKTGEERLEWKRVLCQTNMTKEVILGIQNALMKRGFNPGPIDGKIGSGTLRAVDAYQQKNSMERGGLTLDTIKSLGVKS
jgi:hypothetical protein